MLGLAQALLGYVQNVVSYVYFLKKKLLKMLNNNELKTNIDSELVSHNHTTKFRLSIGYWNACERKSRFMVNNRTTDSSFFFGLADPGTTSRRRDHSVQAVLQ